MFSLRSLLLATAVAAVYAAALSGCTGRNQPPVTITPLSLKAPAEGFAKGKCRLRYGGLTYEMTGTQLQECRGVLSDIYSADGLFLVDRASVMDEFYSLEYCDAESGDVLVALHFYGTVFRDTMNFRVDIDGVGTAYVPEAIGLRLHKIGRSEKLWTHSRFREANF